MIDIKKLTNAAPGWIGNEYACINAFNCDNSIILLIKGEGNFCAYYTIDGTIKDLPILASEEPRWSTKSPSTFYYIPYGLRNHLMSYQISNGQSIAKILREFKEYVAIKGMGESDISEDGDHLVLRGELPDGHFEVFLYNIATNEKITVFPLPKDVDGLKVSADNQIIVSQQNAIYTINHLTGAETKLTNADGHAAVGRDVDGEEILVWTNSADRTPVDHNLKYCPNAIMKVRLSDGFQTCLLPLDWSLAVDISLQEDVLLVSTYAPVDKGAKYTNQILRVALDGSVVEVLCDHGSKPFNSYNWQPKTSLSRDGSRFVFSSNMGLQTQNPEYIDVYMGILKSPPHTSEPEWKPFIEQDQFGNLRMIKNISHE